MQTIRTLLCSLFILCAFSTKVLADASFGFDVDRHEPYTEEELTLFRQTLPRGDLLAEPSQKGKTKTAKNCKKSVWIIPVEDPIDHSRWDLEAELFVPTAAAHSVVPLILMMPPINGIMYMDHKMAQSFCDQNIATFSFDPVRTENRKTDAVVLESYDQTFLRMLTATYWAFETASKMPGVDSSKIGVMGMSLGGIFASVYAAFDPRIKTLMYVASAGYLPGILANTEQKKLAKIREREMVKNSWKNREIYEEALTKVIHHDPHLWANGLKGKRIMAVISVKDRFVPSRYQFDFIEQIRPQVVERVHMGHIAILIRASNEFAKKFADFVNSAE